MKLRSNVETMTLEPLDYLGTRENLYRIFHPLPVSHHFASNILRSWHSDFIHDGSDDVVEESSSYACNSMFTV